MSTEATKLNLGGGSHAIAGYENIDRMNGQEVYPLPNRFADESVDVIRASHILEHFSHREIYDVMNDWVGKLKPGGLLKIAVPDFRKIAALYLDKQKINTSGYIMGGQSDTNDFHRSLFDKDSLTNLMEACGLVDIGPWHSKIEDCASLEISLNLHGTKPIADPASTKPEIAGKSVSGKVDLSKVGAVISMGRLTFSDNQFCATKALANLGIELVQGIGVFWGQILSRSIQEMLDAGKEYIITLDYDTYFVREQVLYMLYIMQQQPTIDALVPLQIRREGDHPLLGKDAPGKIDPERKTATVSINEFKEPLTPIATGHFGMTIFRAEAIRKMSKPWFFAQPNAEGLWEDGRTDEDIYFWNKFKDEGFRAYLTREVGVGHLQLMATFPDTIENGWKPIHKYVSTVRNEGMPGHCMPPIATK